LTRYSINIERKLVAAAPNLELAEVLHLALPFYGADGPWNYLQLNTNNCQLPLGDSHAD
jgi:hypothetical protein